MNNRLLLPTLAIAIASIAATTVPAQGANGWGVGGTPPGFFNRLGGFNNGMMGSNGFAGTGFGGGGCGGGGGGGGQWHHHHHHHHNWMNGGNTAWNSGWNNGYNNGYNNVGFNNGYGNGYGYGNGNGNGYGYGNGGGGFLSQFFGTNGAPTAALSSQLAQRQTYLQGLLSSGNLPANRQSWIQNELSQITGAQNGIAAGTFNRNSLGHGGLRGLLGI